MNSPTGPRTDAPTFSRDELLTPDEVADILRLRRTTAIDYMRRGVIPAFKLGRRWYALRPRLDSYLTEVCEHPPARGTGGGACSHTWFDQ